MSVCTVTDAFLGIPGDECGQAATGTLVAACPNGCTNPPVPICGEHADAFTPPSPGEEVPAMFCPVCAETAGKLVRVGTVVAS